MRKQPSLVRCISSAHDYRAAEVRPFAAPLQSVDVQEMAFGLSLFVGAATKRISFGSDISYLSDVSKKRAAVIYAASATGRSLHYGPKLDRSDQTTLQVAFAQLWNYYEESSLQESVCARVLGFYCLMERTNGVALTPWLSEDPEDAKATILHPSAVAALAMLPMGEQGTLHEADYLALIVELASL